MVSLRISDCHIRVCRKSSAPAWIIATGLAAACAIPHNAYALATGQPKNFSSCEALQDRSPSKLALNSLGNVEPSAGPLMDTKAAAILGGSPSKLEQMRMAQASTSQQGSAAAVVTTAIGVNNFSFDCSTNLTTSAASNALRTLANSAENAVLGSMSVAIHRTPFDDDWAFVNARPNNRKVQRTLAATGARRSGNQAAQVEAVNRWVNHNIAFGEDRTVYGRADYWAPASETLRRGIGDCEDFAIAKMELLSALGIARDKMRLVVARDLARNADHAVLVVTMADGSVMLDNMTDRLLDAHLPNDYRPIMSFSQNTKWVHGYATQQARPVRMALANVVAEPAANRLADVLTVTVEPEMPALSMALLSVPLVLPNGLSARV
jgi:predicted transglutaminase-like cysteine proteinase